MEQNEQKTAVLWTLSQDNKVKCNLCAWRCDIADGKFGVCHVRKNIGGKLYSLNYDKVCAGNVDPIEKKPLFHFQPGSSSFSVACIGCNFKCEFCQNWQISQAAFVAGKIDGQPVTPESIIESALRNNCSSVAYTYTEPTIYMELASECGRLAKENGLANVFVTNGYMTSEAIDFAKDWLDGINIDIKAFTEDFYRRMCHAHLKPVLEAVKYIASKTDMWMEITTLIIPGENDSEQELTDIANFIASNTGVDTPWHISRFYPQYHVQGKKRTPVETIEKAMEIGQKAGLRYIYPGNIPHKNSENTFCYKCGQLLIERMGYSIISNNILRGTCPSCGADIAGFEISGS